MIRSLALLLSCSAIAACTVGPRDLDPHAALPAAATPAPITPASAPGQAFVPATAAPATWWTAFASPQLDALVDEALRRNNDIATADAALRQAGEQARAAGGALLPQVDASYQAERTRVSDAISPVIANQNQQLYTLHTAQVNVSYTLDAFGGARGRVRSARAAAEVQRFRRDAARTTVVANLVQAVVQRSPISWRPRGSPSRSTATS
jgi:outer membrane protein TolC